MGNEADGEGVARLLDFANLRGGEESKKRWRDGGRKKREGRKEGGRKETYGQMEEGMEGG